MTWSTCAASCFAALAASPGVDFPETTSVVRYGSALATSCLPASCARVDCCSFGSNAYKKPARSGSWHVPAAQNVGAGHDSLLLQSMVHTPCTQREALHCSSDRQDAPMPPPGVPSTIAWQPTATSAHAAAITIHVA